jgi:ribosomal protein S18 acetylase RimI-like enzyme
MSEDCTALEPARFDDFAASFRRAARSMSTSGATFLDEPGIVGVFGAGLPGRLLVTDDRAYDVLAGGLPRPRVAMVSPVASRCIDFLRESGLSTDSVTAMVALDLATIPTPTLPPGLRLVSGVDTDGSDGVSLRLAAAACQRADPHARRFDLDGFVAYLRSVHNAVYLAAVDAEGEVRATAASSTYDEDVNVFFVTTDPAWRGRGVGTAMTSAALAAAHERGGKVAALMATASGLPIYLRLGFQVVGELTLLSELA